MRIRKIILPYILFSLIFFFVGMHYSYAGRGCCSWHGGQSYCDSNTGRWVCADGTYSPSCTCGYIPVNIPPQPKPDEVKSGQWNIITSNENWCNKDVEFTWVKPEKASAYSISLSDYIGADPGPNADTYSNTFTFKNINPGRHYVNIKSYYLGYWSKMLYWTIDVPELTPNLYANIVKGENGENVLQYEFSCLQSINGPQELIDYIDSNDKKPKGDVILTSTVGTFEVKGVDKLGNQYVSTLSATQVQSEQYGNQGNSNFLIPVGLLGLSGIWFINKLSKKYLN